MKNLSKILAAFVCATLMFALAACGSTENDTTSAETSAEQTTAAAATDNSTEAEKTTEEKTTEEKTEEKTTVKDTAEKTTEKTTEETEKTTEAEKTESNDPYYVENKTKFDTTKHVFVTFTIKNMGEFQVELYPEYAPNTVTNFVNLADSGHFEGTVFHRVVDGFMAQGGQNTSESVTPIHGEFSSNGFEDNTLHHERGVISMARTTEMDSATDQFFICYADCDFLDGGYAAFGKVTYGMDVLDSFLDIERAPNSLGEFAVPQQDIIIEKTVVSQ